MICVYAVMSLWCYVGWMGMCVGEGTDDSAAQRAAFLLLADALLVEMIRKLRRDAGNLVSG